jgi:hypothetical protein
LNKAFLDAGVNHSPGAGVSAFSTDEEHKQSSNLHVGLIEGPSEVFTSADDDTW